MFCKPNGCEVHIMNASINTKKKKKRQNKWSCAFSCGEVMINSSKSILIRYLVTLIIYFYSNTHYLWNEFVEGSKSIWIDRVPIHPSVH